MDILNQTKLSRAEWKSIESPISIDEKKIMKLIKDGYKNIHLKQNDTLTMMTFSKLENTPEIHFHLYSNFLKKEIEKLINKYKEKIPLLEKFTTQDTTIKKMKSVDALRIKNMESNMVENSSKMFEFVLLDICRDCIRAISKRTSSDIYLYTLIKHV